ncbi:hypothetical protein BDR26DRAFT_856705 [Obelidium mucronatum]|nr:hypothetical protein BDR26DRAFT_856705 [Obelidium mucronatum]
MAGTTTLAFDGVTKRRLALCGLVLVLAVKSHHVFGLGSSSASSEGVLVLWLFLDFAFLVGLRAFRVPRLQFSAAASLGVFLVAALLDVGVVGALLPDSRRLAANADDSLHAASAALGHAHGDSAHIQGSHIVKVVPPTIAKLNPNNAKYCLSASTVASVAVSLQVKGTPPYLVDYELVSLDGRVKKFSNVSIANPAGAENKRGIALYPIEVTSPGIYKLTGLRDSTGMQGRVLNSLTEISACPDAAWVIEDGAKRTSDRCIDDNYDFTVKVKAAGPAQVYYSRKIASEEVIVRLETDESEETAESPWIGDESALPSNRTLPVHTFFKLLYVMDGRNNTVVFPDPHSPPISAEKPDLFVVDSHSHPTVRFAKSEASKIRAPAPGSPHDHNHEGRTTSLPVIFENGGTGPFTFQVSHSESINDAHAGKFTETWTHTSPTSHHAVTVSQPGVYTLHTVHDAYCQGTLSSPQEIIVHQTFPPTISISAESIEQSCVGTIGAYVYKGVRTRRSAKVNKLRESLLFKPVLPGTYVYEFQEVGDATYTEGIPIENVSITQIIHPQSEARFANPQKLTRCMGDTATLPVTLIGSGPWRLTYEIIFENKKERITMDAAPKSGNNIEIVTPKFAAAGSYVVDLIEITDANGCSWLLETPDVSIEVLAQRPSASFSCPKTLHIQPFNIKYVNKKNPERILELRNVNERDTIRVNSPGLYEVLEVSDTFCAGTAKPVECRVETIPKPKLEIPRKEYDSVGADGSFIRKSVCQGVDDTFEVLASGKAPFNFKYTVDATDASGRTSRISSRDDQSGGRVGRYTFTQIADDNYKTSTSLLSPPLVLRQTILERPSATFLDGREKVFQCLGDNPEDGNNAAPFSLTLELKHENHPREVIKLNNIQESSYNFKPPTLSATGKYGIQLVSLSDASGCERVFDREDGASAISVAVSDVARIASLNPESVCVGDVLSYTLQGTPPFTISYEFDGIKQESVQIVDPLLTLYAAEPGTIKITNVCNHMNCCTKPANINNVIHNLPSAIVDGGNDLVEDIREGDETVIGIDFKGVPPFSFTYARRDLNFNAKAAGGKRTSQASKSEESFTVTGVDAYHYDITTSQEGLFHVTAVYDKYCGYPRVKQAIGSANAVLKKKN